MALSDNIKRFAKVKLIKIVILLIVNTFIFKFNEIDRIEINLYFVLVKFMDLWQKKNKFMYVYYSFIKLMTLCVKKKLKILVQIFNFVLEPIFKIERVHSSEGFILHFTINISLRLLSLYLLSPSIFFCLIFTLIFYIERFDFDIPKWDECPN